MVSLIGRLRVILRRWSEASYPGAPTALAIIVISITKMALQAYPCLDVPPIPGFPGVVLAPLSLVALFVTLIYQRRFQRADELVRAVVVIPPQPHPDYYGLMPDAVNGLGKDYSDGHNLTVQFVMNLKEYYQLFFETPLYLKYAVRTFIVLMATAAVHWTVQFGAMQPNLSHIGPFLAAAATIECVGQICFLLWRIGTFPKQGESRDLHKMLGIPSWYSLLDCGYLATRAMPLSVFLFIHECYFYAERKEEQWRLYFELPVPLHNWEWMCRVSYRRETIFHSGWTAVHLSPGAIKPFFADSSQWLIVPIAVWPYDLNELEFDDVDVDLWIRSPGTDLSAWCELRGPWWYGVLPEKQEERKLRDRPYFELWPIKQQPPVGEHHLLDHPRLDWPADAERGMWYPGTTATPGPSDRSTQEHQRSMVK